MINHIGYTSEKFRVTNEVIYKYTNDPARKEFLQSQMNHLLAISRVLPENTPANISWLEGDGEWGYTMEYIKNATRVTDADVVNAVNHMIACSRISAGSFIPDFVTFREYIVSVIKKNTHIYQEEDLSVLETKYIRQLQENEEEFNYRKSSSHGDFTVENILVSGNRLVLIDCIKKEDMWTSWLLDAAKFYQNIYFTDTSKTLTFGKELAKVDDESVITGKLIYLLMISNYIRMFPYISSRDDIMQSRYQEFKFLIQQL